MATLILSRTSQLANRFRKIKVFDGDKLIAELDDGQTKEIELKHGEHSLSAKVDWLGSQELVIELKKETASKVEIGCYAGTNTTQHVLSFISILLLLGSIYFYGEVTLYIWLILVVLWVLRDLIMTKGRSFIYYLTVGRYKYLYLKMID